MKQDIFLLQYFDQNANNFEGDYIEKKFLDLTEANKETIKKIELGFECVRLLKVDESRKIKEILFS